MTGIKSTSYRCTPVTDGITITSGSRIPNPCIGICTGVDTLKEFLCIKLNFLIVYIKSYFTVKLLKK